MVKEQVKKSNSFLTEDNGSKSSIRLMSFISLFAAMMFGVLTLVLSYYGKTDSGNGIMITFGFLLGAFAPKVLQKFAEEKIGAVPKTVE